MRACSSCGGETTDGHFCVRCGAPQTDDFAGRSSGRWHFAAAPHEHVALPMVVSSLFPHLPRASHLAFRLALLLGTVVVIIRPAPRLFPVALIAAALLLPLLVVLYLVEVNVYEDEPLWAMALTIGWGAVTGVGFGLLALDITPTSSSLIVQGGSQYL